MPGELELRTLIFALTMGAHKLKDCISFITDSDPTKRGYGEECISEIIEELQDHLSSFE